VSAPDTLAARAHLLRALEADLVGPFAGAAGRDAAELLPLPPSRWYLTGFLAPHQGRESEDPTDEEELAAGSDQLEEEAGIGQETQPKVRSFLPASLGLSVFLPPAAQDAGADAVRVRVSWADYERIETRDDQGEAGDEEKNGEERAAEPKPRQEGPGEKKPKKAWRRLPRSPVELRLPLDPRALEAGVEVEGSGGLRVKGRLAPADAPGLSPGTRALSVFLVNERSVGEKGRQDERFAFQVELEVSFPAGFVARPNRRDEEADQWDDRVADLQFRERCEWAVGHGVAVEVPPDQGERVATVRTTWLPRHEVRRIEPHREPGVEIGMEALAELRDAGAVRAALARLPEAYAAWIEGRRAVEVGSEARRQTRDQLMNAADRARRRIAEGIALLAEDPEALDAFRLANRAMAEAALRRAPAGRYDEKSRPTWRLFQLAFLLLNLPSVADPTHPDRENVELIFFPTGGGKTEAYLGVIAFALLLRRLRGRARPDGGLGVAVLLRYTLRLLTLDQLDRAATLVCALEKIRQARPERLGEVRFAVGLWVGRSATANTLEHVANDITAYKNNPSPHASSPFPLTACPWCTTDLTRDSLRLVPNKTRPEAVVAACTDFRCDFSERRNPQGLPVLFVDEQIYRELPSFVVATVDKFAMLPWRGETGMLFGRVSAREGHRFFGPMDRPPSRAERLPDGLLPPELIVQDELHLISGPLGTMVGLYETAIHWLATRALEAGGAVARPKVLSATATVRRAPEQVKALFGRDQLDLFPPPGVDDQETWFARVDLASPGRLYLGVAAQGRAMRAILLRTYVCLMASAARAARDVGPEAADPYMTLVGYFNSLRELGGMRRLVEDEVRTRCLKAEERRLLGGDAEGDAHPWFVERKVQAEPVELTSREATGRVANSKARLKLPHTEKEHVDVLLASNMISVGLDVDRLGLMVVAGQPKTTSEYIQASSRVGRQHPGLVVTCMNLARPRDRSHYERFASYHESFYRFVEATSLTPFSGPALDRGLAGVLLAMARFADPELTPPAGAMTIAEKRKVAERALAELAERGARLARDQYEDVKAALMDRGANLLDAWEKLVKTARDEAAGPRCYSRFDPAAEGKPLLYTVVDEEKPLPGSDEAKFAAPTSMRDVEPNVHLWLERSARLGGRG